MLRAHNFSAGPGALPRSVLEQTQQAVIELPETGLSVLGMSHRSAWFERVLDETERNLRELLHVPASYRVLFMQGGATLQFAILPMLFLARGGFAEYLDTGYWSAKSIAEARRFGDIRVPWSGAAQGYDRLPKASELTLSESAKYFHYVSNETVEGLQFHDLRGLSGVPRVCDLSSDFLARPTTVSDFALLYAHAQKNLGPAGVTVVIVHESVLEKIPEGLPTMLDYRRYVETKSIYNTPPVFAVYVTLLVTRWLRDEIGGLEAMEQRNAAKALRLYRAIAESREFYRSSILPRDRSLMNVTFQLSSPERARHFVAAAEARGLHGLAGHRARGGVRASLYNAVELESVDALADFMTEYALG
ncbi:MAG TPA: 3-phosphoserine/phosphohydroxythreonine transaminase [Polyangiaceae bacterium]|jgi:phosphoserine aminotransferase|nr:3-phosphoserine/phosphohydroxythreonine transaminase [Polyangiaceae bacterium]